jgi:hypothetical protein
MTAASLPQVVRETFAIQTLPADRNEVAVKLTGNGDLQMKPALADFLKALHEEARRLGATRVRVDLTELYFMNSSCLKCAADWLGTVAKALAPERYRVEFITNPTTARSPSRILSSSWRGTSLTAFPRRRPRRCK